MVLYTKYLHFNFYYGLYSAVSVIHTSLLLCFNHSAHQPHSFQQVWPVILLCRFFLMAETSVTRRKIIQTLYANSQFTSKILVCSVQIFTRKQKLPCDIFSEEKRPDFAT